VFKVEADFASDCNIGTNIIAKILSSRDLKDQKVKKNIWTSSRTSAYSQISGSEPFSIHIVT
jgi:hypothetical protein